MKVKKPLSDIWQDLIKNNSNSESDEIERLICFKRVKNNGADEVDLYIKNNDSDELIAGQEWLQAMPGYERRSPQGRNVDRILLVPKPYATQPDMRSYLCQLSDWRVYTLTSQRLGEDISSNQTHTYLIEKIAASSVYRDLQSDRLPDSNAPFYLLFQSDDKNNVWLPRHASVPFGIIDSDIVSKCVSQLALVHAVNVDHSLLFWLPQSQGQFHKVLHKKPLSIIPSINTSPAPVPGTISQDEIQIPTQLLKKQGYKRDYSRSSTQKIYYFKTVEYRDRYGENYSPEKFPSSMLFLMDLHMSSRGKRRFDYQCLEIWLESDSKRERIHLFREKESPRSGFLDKDSDGLFIEVVFELPREFDDAGINVFLEDDCCFVPDVESFESDSIRTYLAEMLTQSIDLSSHDDSTLFLLKKNKSNNPDLIVIDESNFVALDQVIKPVTGGMYPDRMSWELKNTLEDDVEIKISNAGSKLVSFLDDVVLKKVVDESSSATKTISGKLSQIDETYKKIIQLHAEFNNLLENVESSIAQFLTKDWDIFKTGVFEKHNEIIDVTDRWRIKNIEDLKKIEGKLQDACTNSQTSIERVTNELASVSSKLNALKTKIKELKGLIPKGEKLNTETIDYLEYANVEESKISSQVNEYYKSCQSTLVKIDDLTKKIKEASKNLGDRKKNVDKKNADLTLKKTNLEQQKQSLLREQNHYRSLVKEVEILKSSIKEKERELAELKTDYLRLNHDAVKNEHALLLKEVSNTKYKITEAERLVSELSNLKQDKSNLIGTFRELEIQAKSLEKETKQLEVQIDQKSKKYQINLSNKKDLSSKKTRLSKIITEVYEVDDLVEQIRKRLGVDDLDPDDVQLIADLKNDVKYTLDQIERRGKSPKVVRAIRKTLNKIFSFIKKK